MQFLENEFLRVAINEFGAELTSIVRRMEPLTKSPDMALRETRNLPLYRHPIPV